MGRFRQEVIKIQQEKQQKNEQLQLAVEEYKKRGLDDTFVGDKGYRAVAKEFNVCYSTLRNRIKGVVSISEFNAKKALLSDAESTVLVELIKRSATRGFSMGASQIESYADFFLKKKYGPEFGGVGKNWRSAWMAKWGSEIAMYWSTSLETVRANALTEENVTHWFRIFLEVWQRFEIAPERTGQMDEVGFLLSVGRKQKVAGPTGARVQYTQRSQNREMVTMISTILGDGTFIPPTVIFKGKNLPTALAEDNPLECS